MNKRIFLLMCALICLCWSLPASAAISVTIDYAYTSDNFVQSFYITGALIEPSMEYIENKDSDWRTAATGSLTYNLQPGAEYLLTWNVVNQTPPELSKDNPMAFVGQFRINGSDYFLTDAESIWSIKDAGGTEMITSYGPLAGPNKWTEVGTGLLGNSIINTAEWIGLGAYPGQGNSMTVTAKFMAPVPIPGAALLLGSAILGLVGIRRRQLV
jgi:hypothetical protein